MQTVATQSELSVEAPTVVDTAEAHLVSEVGELWQGHAKAKTSLHKTQGELKVIRANLSQRLHELKAVLSRPGRGGAWSSFLQAQRIPRSSADRLVRSYEKTVSADGENCTTEQIKEPAEATVRRYLHGLWPRLSRVLSTPEHVAIFMAELKIAAAKSFSADDEGSSSPVSAGVDASA